MSTTASTLILVIVAILLPPVAVFMIDGCGCDLLISVILTILGYIPGHIHAFWLIYKRAKAEESYGRGNFVYVGSGEYAPGHGETAPLNHNNYGATGSHHQPAPVAGSAPPYKR